MSRETLHTPSLLVGALGVAVVLLLVSASHVAIQALRVTITQPVEIAPRPHPSDMIRVMGGTAYVVPVGKILVLTAVGSTQAGVQTVILVDGIDELNMNGQLSTSSVFEVPEGLTAQAGQVVTLVAATGSLGNARAWGYVIDA